MCDGSHVGLRIAEKEFYAILEIQAFEYYSVYACVRKHVGVRTVR